MKSVIKITFLIGGSSKMDLYKVEQLLLCNLLFNNFYFHYVEFDNETYCKRQRNVIYMIFSGIIIKMFSPRWG